MTLVTRHDTRSQLTLNPKVQGSTPCASTKMLHHSLCHGVSESLHVSQGVSF